MEEKSDVKKIEFPKYKNTIMNSIYLYSSRYLSEVDSSQGGKIKLSVDAKKQLLYIFYTIVNIGNRIDYKGSSDISGWVQTNLKTSSVEYMMYMYIKNISDVNIFISLNEEIEDKIEKTICDIIEDKNVSTHIFTIWRSFSRRLSKAIADFNWSCAKKIDNNIFNFIIRVLDVNNTNPILFYTLYGVSKTL